MLLAHNMPECIPVRRGDALKGVVKREPHSRKPGCYILDDKYREYIILAQKLPTIVRYLNSTPTVVADATVRVSVMSLYQIQNSAGTDRVGGYSKHRWRVRHVPFADATRIFQSERDEYRHTLIVGERGCYEIGQECS